MIMTRLRGYRSAKAEVNGVVSAAAAIRVNIRMPTPVVPLDVVGDDREHDHVTKGGEREPMAAISTRRRSRFAKTPRNELKMVPIEPPMLPARGVRSFRHS